MLSLEDLRKIDPALCDTSDAELEEIRAALYELGQLGFDFWWEKSGSKNPVWSLTGQVNTDSMDV